MVGTEPLCPINITCRRRREFSAFQIAMGLLRARTTFSAAVAAAKKKRRNRNSYILHATTGGRRRSVTLCFFLLLLAPFDLYTRVSPGVRVGAVHTRSYGF